ncbi:FUSC family protein [Govanella unica]|uniref:FUSC family protein n=1 Tax=Govanella unica TaxID=2975056 RepID=A0A9X3Z7P2_9PROT|nr:FUSC family protein [Govania unica]MDA5194387.1 FUSC family protein [Govania unica]
MILPGRKEWIFSVKAFIGAMSAVYIAFQIDLSRPVWAMLTAYIVAQPLAGMVQSKAVYRAIGTVIGSALAIVVVTEFINAPELMTLILALWVALCVYVTVLEKSPRSYMLMLSGYTVVIIASQSVTTPDLIFDTALSRCEEILLGIGCAILANNLIFPQRVGPVLLARLDSWLQDAVKLTRGVLNGMGDKAEADRDFARLTSDAIALDALRFHAVYDTPKLRAAENVIIALRHRMQNLLPLLVGVQDRGITLRLRSPAVYDQAAPLLRRTAAWLDDPKGTPSSAADIQLDLAAAMPSDLDIRKSWDQLLLRTILQRLSDIISAWGECYGLRRNIDSISRDQPPVSGPARIAVHRDHLVAALSGMAAAVSVGLTGLFWMFTGWPHGSVAMMMSAVGASIFSAQDDPGPVVVRFLYLSIPAAMIAGVYEVAIFPAFSDFPMLVLVLAPTYLILGAFLAIPAYAPSMMPLLLGATGILSISNTLPIDFENFVNGAVAQVFGLGISAIVLMLMRRLGTDWAAARLMGAVRRDLVRIAAGDPTLRQAEFESRMTDRLAELVPRLAGSEAKRHQVMTDAQAGYRLGLNMLALQQIRPDLPGTVGPAVTELLRALQRYFSIVIPDQAKINDLVGQHDLVMRLIAQADVSATTTQALIILGGMRHSLLIHNSLNESVTKAVSQFVDPLVEGQPA